MLHNYNYFFFLYIPAPPLFLQLLPELLVSSSLHIDLLWLLLPASLAVRSLLLRPSLLCSRLGSCFFHLLGSQSLSSEPFAMMASASLE